MVKSILIRINWKIYLPSNFPQMGLIFARWMHGNIRPIWGNFEGRWIIQVTLMKMDFSLSALPINLKSIPDKNDVAFVDPSKTEGFNPTHVIFSYFVTK